MASGKRRERKISKPSRSFEAWGDIGLPQRHRLKATLIRLVLFPPRFFRPSRLISRSFFHPSDRSRCERRMNLTPGTRLP